MLSALVRALGLLFGLRGGLRIARNLSHPEAGGESARDAAIRRRIVACVVIFGAAGLAIGVAWDVAAFGGVPEVSDVPPPESQAWDRRKWEQDRKARAQTPAVMVALPAIATMGGLAFGGGLGLLLAPASFLAGPVGRRWLALVGTEDVAAARGASGCVVVLAGGLGLFAAYFLYRVLIRGG